MATILGISSQTAYGSIGISAYQFVLQKLGHEVICFPTGTYLTHPELGRTIGHNINADTLSDMGAELISMRLDEKISWVISGYFFSAEQAESVKWFVTQLKVRNPNILYCCDPVIGDTPEGMYVDTEIAQYIKNILVPMADMVSPNKFETNYLGKLNNKQILLKSVNGNENHFIEAGNTIKQPFNPVDKYLAGAGDLFSALFIGYKLNGLSAKVALEKATKFLQILAEYSIEHNCKTLPIVENQHHL